MSRQVFCFLFQDPRYVHERHHTQKLTTPATSALQENNKSTNSANRGLQKVRFFTQRVHPGHRGAREAEAVRGLPQEVHPLEHVVRDKALQTRE